MTFLGRIGESHTSLYSRVALLREHSADTLVRLPRLNEQARGELSFARVGRKVLAIRVAYCSIAAATAHL
jgi:hypothetical protein